MYGCSSGGVPASALVINSSNTSLGGSGSDMVEGDFCLGNLLTPGDVNASPFSCSCLPLKRMTNMAKLHHS